MEEFDLVVIGSGPAGYTGAIRAAQLGMKVACIEKRKTLGGTCLNVGCIPSKSLLNFSEKYEFSKKHFSEIGIEAKIKLDVQKMIAKKDKIVSDLCKGIDGLFVKNKIKRFFGSGQINSPNEVQVIKDDGTISKINTKKILIATGSDILRIPSINIDEKNILSSTGALELQNVPESMIVIGAGVIGLELGSVWRRLGSKVTIIEFGDKVAPGLDLELSKNLHKILSSQGMEFIFNTKVISAKSGKDNVVVEITDKNGENPKKLTATKILVSIGRKAYTENLGLENIGIDLDDRGRINVNHKFQTKYDNIYAVGDVIAGPMLAHKAEEEAVAAVEIMAGQAGHVNYNTIPSVIYTHPEVATVGMTEEELKAKNIEYKVGKFPFLANSRAKAIDVTDGMVKILADKKTDEILGAHIIGIEAGTIISEITVGMAFKAASEDIARICHPHPTLSEAIKEACLAVDKRTINF